MAASLTRWGILGCGKISADFATALIRTEGTSVVAVAGRSASASSTTAFAADLVARQKGGAPIAACDYDSLAARDDVDIVYVGNVNTAHFASTMKCIEAGKHVLVEKPIGVNYAEAAALVKAAREKGVFLMEGLWTRFLPAVVKARSIIEGGELGDVVAVHGDFGFRCDDATDSRMFDPALAGGGLLDIGIYPLGFASMAFGGAMPTEIKAVGTTHPVTGVDTSAGITALFPPSSSGSSSSSTTSSGGGDADPLAGPGLAVITYNLRVFTPEEVVIVGTKARLVIKGPAHIATKLALTKPDGRSGMAEETFDLPLPEPDASFEYNYPGSEGFQFQIEEVQRCLAAKLTECPGYGHAEMLNIARTMEEARRQLGVAYPADAAKPAIDVDTPIVAQT